MLEDQIEAHARSALSLAGCNGDFMQDCSPQNREYDSVRRWFLGHKSCTDEEKPSNASVQRSLAHLGTKDFLFSGLTPVEEWDCRKGDNILLGI
jgi:hypothetical protein